jgi:hypothetical protein
MSWFTNLFRTVEVNIVADNGSTINIQANNNQFNALGYDSHTAPQIEHQEQPSQIEHNMDYDAYYRSCFGG